MGKIATNFHRPDRRGSHSRSGNGGGFVTLSQERSRRCLQGREGRFFRHCRTCTSRGAQSQLRNRKQPRGRGQVLSLIARTAIKMNGYTERRHWRQPHAHVLVEEPHLLSLAWTAQTHVRHVPGSKIFTLIFKRNYGLYSM